jgi:hypothetical protein
MSQHIIDQLLNMGGDPLHCTICASGLEPTQFENPPPGWEGTWAHYESSAKWHLCLPRSLKERLCAQP